MNRRHFLTSSLAASFAPGVRAQSNTASTAFDTRGAVVGIPDLLSLDWPALAKGAGLTTLATHFITADRFKYHRTDHLVEFLRSDRGQIFLAGCKEAGLEVEHEIHAMQDLLPRELFKKDPSMFRMDEKGNRIADANCCIHSKDAVEIICENAVRYAALLQPTTHRHFFWFDDGKPVCHCPQCRVYSASDQALILENAMIKALREKDDRATLAHLAYGTTLAAPKEVRPEDGIFLEFAPIHRNWSKPLHDEKATGRGKSHAVVLENLDANLEVFSKDSSQVLEYWLDISLFSDWKKPPKKLPWKREIFLADIETYAKRGIKNVTSFAVFLDQDYIELHGPPTFLKEYAEGLDQFQL